jgi:hypothetical protein
MPKVKKQLDSDSDSSDGPEDRNPPKKAKTEDSDDDAGGSSKKGSSGKKNKAGEMQFEIEKTRFVTVRTFKGKTYIDIREFYDAGGELKPGKKGISLNPTQWEKLKSLIPEVDEAVKDM